MGSKQVLLTLATGNDEFLRVVGAALARVVGGEAHEGAAF